MNDAAAALRPIEEAGDAIRRLEEYETDTDLAAAIEQVWKAVDRSLRLRLRADTSAPDDERLSALSGERRTTDEVVQSLRTRDLISLPLAGTVHELRAAAERAREGQVRSADADVALRAVAKLRQELRAPAAAAEPIASAATLPEDTEADADAFVPPERRGRWTAWLAAGLAALALLLLAWAMTRGSQDDYDAGVAAFRAGRLDSAAVTFERVLEDRPEDVSVMLYLGRIYRRQERSTEAAGVLREAARVAPSDADVRRELGHLFMDLQRPTAAAAQYQLAVDQEPEETSNWIGLIRALRAANDPRAERLLRDAPADVQAALGGAAPG